MYWIILLLWVQIIRGNTENVSTLSQNSSVDISSPQTFNFNNEVTSGPVILVDKKTLYIPNFRYKGDHKNVRFWVGNGSEPSSDGLPIQDESNSSESLHAYQGQNVNLHLPEGVTTDNIEYFAVWSIDEAVSLGHVPIKGITGVPEVGENSPNADFILRLPKCCAKTAVLTNRGCEEKSGFWFQPNFNVYEHNDTHFKNESLDLSLVAFEPYTFTLECPSGKFPLDQANEEFGLLVNGSLLVKGAAGTGIWSQEEFCLENIEGENNTLQMKILVCVMETKIQKAMCYTYIAMTIISLLCFAITFFLYCFLYHVEDIHRICFTAYTLEMGIVFLCMTVVQVAHVEDGGCAVLGFFFQFFMIGSFTLLAILCIDIWIIIKNIDDEVQTRKRECWFSVAAISVPLFFLVISLTRNLTPDVPNSFFKPQYQTNGCYFEEENQRVTIFYIPIMLSILLCAVFLSLAKYKIVQNDKHKSSNYFWIEYGKTYKFMFRQCLLTSVIMTISWISNVLMSFLDETSGILSAAVIFEASQGILIVAVFTMHHYGTTYLEKQQQQQQNQTVEMNPLNQNSH